MSSSLANAIVALTDREWFDHFRPTDEVTLVDEVNFWRPSAQTRFAKLPVGSPFFFRLKSPFNAIAGYGFFAHQIFLDVRTAWDYFEEQNGDATSDRFVQRLMSYRRVSERTLLSSSSAPLNCIAVRDVVFLPQSAWVSWTEGQGWKPKTQTFHYYSPNDPASILLAAILQASNRPTIPDLLPHFHPVEIDTRPIAHQTGPKREGQGTFRSRILDAYGRHCAVTNEHTVPVLDAAHIQPYLGLESNHPQNGLLLRSDIHRLFERGYLTVTPDYRLAVSGRLHEDFHNGRIYYAMDGKPIALPERPEERPSSAALEWHAKHVFLGA